MWDEVLLIFIAFLIVIFISNVDDILTLRQIKAIEAARAFEESNRNIYFEWFAWFIINFWVGFYWISFIVFFFLIVRECLIFRYTFLIWD